MPVGADNRQRNAVNDPAEDIKTATDSTDGARFSRVTSSQKAGVVLDDVSNDVTNESNSRLEPISEQTVAITFASTDEVAHIPNYSRADSIITSVSECRYFVCCAACRPDRGTIKTVVAAVVWTLIIGTVFLLGSFFAHLTSSMTANDERTNYSEQNKEVESLVTCPVGKTISRKTAGFGLAKYYSSHMVLQRAPVRPRVWGYSDNVGDVIRVSISSLQTLSVSAIHGPDDRPTWSAVFNPISSPGPFQVTILQLETDCQIVLDDVLVGDVYICSGQSNMCHQMSDVDDPDQDLEDVINYPDVRTFYTGFIASSTPVHDLIAVRRTWSKPEPDVIGEFSAVCWLFGRNLNRKLKRPIGLIQTCWSSTRIEAWSSPDAVDVCFPGRLPGGNSHNSASTLWNAMIHPYLQLPVFGAVWYQGENNQGNWMQYACALKTMMTDWRAKWNALNREMSACFPFGVVQLAPNRDLDAVDGFPNVRWAQTYNHGYLPNQDLQCSFLAVSVDLPDYNSPVGVIHPRFKRQIADRLALAAFHVAYGITDVGLFQGPRPVQYSFGVSTIEFTYDVPLEMRATKGFELCCSSSATGQCTPNGSGGTDGSWSVTDVVNNGSQSVELTNICLGSSMPFAVGFRYLWRESPCNMEACPIYSVENGLPAPPYYLSFNKVQVP